MLNLQSKLCKLVFAALVFSMVAFGLFAPAPGLAEGAKAKSMTIDFSRSGKKGEFAGRSVSIWKVSDDITGKKLPVKGKDPLNEVNRTLDALDVAALDKEYGAHITKETNAQSILVVDLSRGIYYVRVEEKKGAAKVYPFVFTVDPESNNMVIYPKGAESTSSGVELTKVSTDKVPLPGAVFQLFRYENNNRIPVKDPNGGADFTTDATGKIVIKDLAPGKYVFVETKAPAGYRIKHPEVPFEIADKKVKKVEVVNYQDKQGGKTFKKVSSKDNSPLAGAQFLVTQKKGETYLRMKKGGKDMVLTSGADGTFVADGLPDGDYHLWEIKAPAGYEPLSSSVKFIVSADSLKKELVIKNNPQATPPGKTPPGTTPPGTTPPYDDKHVNIPKTGDVQLLLMSVTGLLSSMLGVKILKDNE